MTSINVGQTLTDDELNGLPSNRGRKSLIDEKQYWFEMMDNAKGQWVVLEMHNNQQTNSARLRNRVTNLNKRLLTEKKPYKFSTKTSGDEVLFIGRYS